VTLEGPAAVRAGKRPRCRCCGDELRPFYRNRFERRPLDDGGFREVKAARYLVGYGLNGDGYFCRLHCGYEWAVGELEGRDRAGGLMDPCSHGVPLRDPCSGCAIDSRGSALPD
jgi:hypothetical protein